MYIDVKSQEQTVMKRDGQLSPPLSTRIEVRTYIYIDSHFVHHFLHFRFITWTDFDVQFWN